VVQDNDGNVAATLQDKVAFQSLCILVVETAQQRPQEQFFLQMAQERTKPTETHRIQEYGSVFAAGSSQAYATYHSLCSAVELE